MGLTLASLNAASVDFPPDQEGGTKITLSSSHNPEDLVNLTDNNPNNRWTSKETKKPGMWLMLQADKPILFKSLTFDTTGSDGDYPKGYELYVSDDGKSWGEPVAKGKGATVTNIPEINKKAKFVKLLFTEGRGGWWSIHNLKINDISIASAKAKEPGKAKIVKKKTAKLAKSAETPEASFVFTAEDVKLDGHARIHGKDDIYLGFADTRKKKSNIETGGIASWEFKVDKALDQKLILTYELNDVLGNKNPTLFEIPGVIEKTVQLPATGKQNFYEWEIFPVKLKPGNYELKITNLGKKSFQAKKAEITKRDADPFGNFYPAVYVKKSSWPGSMVALRAAYKTPEVQNAVIYKGEKRVLYLNPLDGRGLWRDFPKQSDWFLQDNQVHGEWGDGKWDARKDYKNYLDPKRDNTLEKKLFTNLFKELGNKAKNIKNEYDALVKNNTSPDNPAWLKLYEKVCLKRRQQRLKSLLKHTDKIAYTTHLNLGTIYLATEGQIGPDGTELRMIDLSPLKEGKPLKDEVLLDAQNGIIRDPDVSFDGKTLIFAWKFWPHKRNKDVPLPEGIETTCELDIFEMDLASRKIRRLTDEKTWGADFEPCYLPNGDIMFSSQRIIQEVTCGFGQHSNLFIMNKDGKYARRIGFDQTQTAFPHLLRDGRVIYTRRDYNDRGNTYGHGLFVMNADGTGQTEYYGNNTCEPTTFQHTRQIPGTNKTMAVAGGYHTSQGGKLVIIDPRKGNQEYQGLEFINWDYTKKITGDDRYAREGEQYQYPYPFNENEFLVSFEPIGGYYFDEEGRVNHFAEREGTMNYNLYFMTKDGKRELLASNPRMSCNQAISLAPRKRPVPRPNLTNYKKKTGTMYVQDVYYGQSSKGLKRGSVKKIRVVELYYKPTNIGAALWGPPKDQVGPGKKYGGFGVHSLTPVGVGTASFDAKGIIGEADVEEDGSAMFEVPARRPIFLQLIDKDGHVAQTMRSWATLMPNERFSCVGCHESKLSTPVVNGNTIAMSKPPQKLKPLAKITGKPFSYAKMVQPILNAKCVSCHAPGKKAEKIDLTDTIVRDVPEERGANSTRRKFYKSYLTLLKVKRLPDKKNRLSAGEPNEWINHHTRLMNMEIIPPYYAGSATSGLLKMLKKGHHNVKLTQDELDTISAWIDLNIPFIGEYDEMNDWDEKAIKKYAEHMDRRKKMEAIEAENIKAYIEAGQP